MPSTGAVFAVTVTVRLLDAAIPFSSVACNVTSLVPAVSAQSAPTVAVIVPLVF